MKIVAVSRKHSKAIQMAWCVVLNKFSMYKILVYVWIIGKEMFIA